MLTHIHTLSHTHTLLHTLSHTHVLTQDMAARAADTEAQLVRVTTELAEYKAESASLQNQTHTVRALQDKVKVLEATVQEKVCLCGGVWGFVCWGLW